MSKSKEKTKANSYEFNDEFEYKTRIDYNEDKKTYYMYITDTITAPSDYTNVLSTFEKAQDGDIIEAWFCTPGGRKDTLDLIRGAVANSKAHTKAVLGDVASAGTIIPLVFDELVSLPNTEFMIHSASSGAWGKYHEMLAGVRFWEEEMPKHFKNYYKDFLTPEEIEFVIAGNDIYLNAEEVNARWVKVIQAREEEASNVIDADIKEQIANCIEELNRLGIDVNLVTNEQEPIVNTKRKPTKKAPVNK